MLLPDQTYEGAPAAAPAGPGSSAALVPLATLLRSHHVRPDFFCTYRSRHAQSNRTSALYQEKKEVTLEERSERRQRAHRPRRLRSQRLGM
ncbi:unnamed protein product [Euphydryas editha]|uniref:Uncharacterized protein n=1 Tax=Euphydryas editha TaxID=104508 RepID=A0AAU9U454_EUPED|nr:unnamed protein product [Euphydryas editha]